MNAETMKKRTKAELVTYIDTLESRVMNLTAIIELSDDGKLRLIGKLWNMANDMACITGCIDFGEEFLAEMHKLGIYGGEPKSDEFQAMLRQEGAL